MVQPGILEANGRLHISGRSLLAQDVGDVIGAEGACSGGLIDGLRDRLRTVVTDQIVEFGDLTGQRPAGASQFAEIHGSTFTELGGQALLGAGELSCRTLCEQLLFETIGAEALATAGTQ